MLMVCGTHRSVLRYCSGLMLSRPSMLCVFEKFFVSRSLSVSPVSGPPDFCFVYLLVPIDLAVVLSSFGRLCFL